MFKCLRLPDALQTLNPKPQTLNVLGFQARPVEGFWDERLADRPLGFQAVRFEGFRYMCT